MKKKISIIGLGYVGLPLAMAFEKHYRVVGYDVLKERISQLKIGKDINNEFTKNEIPEFILYWNEKGEISDTWNSKFIAQVRRQWAKTQHLIDNSEVPEPISSDWKPSEDFYEVLALTRINKNFADSVLAEFILYWKETAQAHNSWNSKFIQHVKFQWQRQRGYNSPKMLDDIDRRVESSWAIKTEEEALGRKPLSKKEVINQTNTCGELPGKWQTSAQPPRPNSGGYPRSLRE